MSECKHLPKLKEAELMTRPFREENASLQAELDQARELIGECEEIIMDLMAGNKYSLGDEILVKISAWRKR